MLKKYPLWTLDNSCPHTLVCSTSIFLYHGLVSRVTNPRSVQRIGQLCSDEKHCVFPPSWLLGRKEKKHNANQVNTIVVMSLLPLDSCYSEPGSEGIYLGGNFLIKKKTTGDKQLPEQQLIQTLQILMRVIRRNIEERYEPFKSLIILPSKC